jgi:hypothetical protein
MGERGREMEEDKAKFKHGNTMPKKFHPLTKIWRQFQEEDGKFLCGSYALTYLPEHYT